MEIEKSSACCFQLRSFTPGSAPKGLKISGSVGRRPGSLHIEYRVEGDLHRIIRPMPVPGPTRRHELWRQTCFEFFLGIQGESAYWEGNLSPCGAWNVYRFSDHRQEMREENAVGGPVCRMEAERGRLLFSCTIDIRDICKDCIPLEAGIACVIEDFHGAVSYWAVDHCGSKPDFHDRRSFLLKLPAIA
ncbi:MAG: hypothetical protein VR65_12895 [Desulfobulbaceae bacterium BRH_c16a]|nr:MAG: hypothetical protein VR65_12895 [Desulfobulbaceae bacterium BRH_c16a]